MRRLLLKFNTLVYNEDFKSFMLALGILILIFGGSELLEHHIDRQLQAQMARQDAARHFAAGEYEQARRALHEFE